MNTPTIQAMQEREELLWQTYQSIKAEHEAMISAAAEAWHIAKTELDNAKLHLSHQAEIEREVQKRLAELQSK